ncbi:hypothetical protein ACI2L1_27785 [Streptomyces sp. NPDC019531]
MSERTKNILIFMTIAVVSITLMAIAVHYLGDSTGPVCGTGQDKGPC